MKILFANQIKKLDQLTLERENLTSQELMEKASGIFFRWMMDVNQGKKDFLGVLVGPGNNGGDGLVIARLADPYFSQVKVWLLQSPNSMSSIAQRQISLLPPTVEILEVDDPKDFKFHNFSDYLLIDALFGYGLNRELSGKYRRIVELMNQSKSVVYSIDLPSGLINDEFKKPKIAVKAYRTLTFEFPKLPFFNIRNKVYTGDWQVKSIGLSADIYEQMKSEYQWITESLIIPAIKSRKSHHHKGSFGHTGLAVGSRGMAGAAILAARACMRGGSGKTSVVTAESSRNILQSTVPEAMVISDCGHHVITDMSSLQNKKAIGIGCGIGKNIKTKRALKTLLSIKTLPPLVLDADALNIVAEEKWLSSIPHGTILTPHKVEFERLFGKHENEARQLETLRNASVHHNITIIMKGAYTVVSHSDGQIFFNSTGNPGMATAGSGDVLLGILASLRGQGLNPLEAAQLGVFVHGLSGDIAARSKGYIGLIASDIIEALPNAFQQLQIKYKS